MTPPVPQRLDDWNEVEMQGGDIHRKWENEPGGSYHLTADVERATGTLLVKLVGPDYHATDEYTLPAPDAVDGDTVERLTQDFLNNGLGEW